MANIDDRTLPIQGPDGELVTYGMARANAEAMLRGSSVESGLAKVVLALIHDAEHLADEGERDG